jgi:hypothetical protein
MLKKSLKYFAIAFANMVVLTVMLALWTDQITVTFHDLVRPIEFLKIIGILIVSLLAMRLLVYFFRRKNNTRARVKIIMAVALTLLISSYLYFDYSVKIARNSITNGRIRQQAGAKISPSHLLAYGSSASGLTITEYEEIRKETWFPPVPAQSSNIGYNYGYDGFLPDYLFELTYYVPKAVRIDTFHYQQRGFSREQTFTVKGGNKKVEYSEGIE